MRIRLAVLLSMAAATAQMQGALPIAARAQGAAITFETPRVADPIHTYGEPDIGVAPNQPAYVAAPSNQTSGEVYVSGPTGTGTQRSIWQGSVDGGHTFRNVTRVPPPVPINPCGILGTCTPLAAPGGGDTEINFDHSRQQYFADLYALACQHTATRTVDPGTHQETVNENYFNGGCPFPGSDRQWILVKDPLANYGPGPNPSGSSTPLIYMEANTVAGCNTNGGGGWYRSTDGLSYASAITGQPGGAGNTYCPFGADGYPSIDQTTGKVLQAEFGTVNSADAIQLNIGTPVDAAGDLCFLDDTVTAACQGGALQHGLITVAVNNPALHDVVHDNTSEAANFTVSSIDRGRNLWVVWVDHASTPAQHQAWVSVAPFPWTSWSTPVKVSAAPSQVAIFPWIQAGDAGRADVVWYGDSTLAAPNDTTVQHKWDVYMSQVVYPQASPGPAVAAGAATGSLRAGRTAGSRAIDTSATPTMTEVKVTPHPMDLEDVCLLGTACITALGNRNLADYFEIRTDNTGAAMIVYDDMSNGLCQQTFGCPQVQAGDHAGAGVVTVARQASGPGLFNDPNTGLPMDASGPSNAPVTGLADASGDALFPLFGGTNIPQMDILDNRLSTSGQTLTITTKIGGDPRDAAGATTASGCAGPTCGLQFVTRWQMGNNLYYAMFENQPPGGQAFYAGAVRTIDDCSVSACDPHALVYPDLTGTAENGTVDCPPTPSVATPCTITERVNLADIGSPTNSSLLEEVGSYAFSATAPESSFTQATERADSGATEIDGVCCYNFQAAGIVYLPLPSSGIPTPNSSTVRPTLPLLLVTLAGALMLVELGSRLRRLRRRRPPAR